MSALTFFDVETTGLSHDDRVVTLGALHIEDEDQLKAGDSHARAVHLIFNPGRPSHPRARKAHGYSDDTLAAQDTFADHADVIESYFDHGGAAIAHNASFDRRFVTKEIGILGRPAPKVDFVCTMLMHRKQFGPPSGLDPVLRQMGLSPREDIHGALTDAWFAMSAYCWLRGWPVPDISTLPVVEPLNLRLGPIPNRTQQFPPVGAPTPFAARSSTYQAAFTRIQPIATLLMAIARADGEVLRTEIEVISLLMNTMLAGQSPLSDDDQQDLLAGLIDLQCGDDELQKAASDVVANPHLRQIAGNWVRQITMADGTGSEAELLTVNKIAGMLRTARLS